MYTHIYIYVYIYIYIPCVYIHTYLYITHMLPPGCFLGASWVPPGCVCACKVCIHVCALNHRQEISYGAVLAVHELLSSVTLVATPRVFLSHGVRTFVFPLYMGLCAESYSLRRC